MTDDTPLLEAYDDEHPRVRYWTYGLTRETVEDEVRYCVRELYLDAEHNVVSWTEDPTSPYGVDSVRELQMELERYEKAAMSPRAFDVDAGDWVDVPAEDSQ